ncbi:hypothetical protein EAE91_11295 [Photorhabdus noenieputensis]|uniref:aromatic-ring-hydroxylating dioxygenase subunit beta n=1 Tax=Photorhabdus TaxID=29487 RepID=UPI001BD5410B|nr:MULTISPECIES: aromatic-ring-hydroxylating dioxygenase subunit beta [Photorhabdus]MBS9425201.1 hypothetical protein [Photorhabdus caribbeanensis]MBS9437729.1 hypothetical protein [Photorhabdus noenieputensis]MCK3667879.1 nuclear transport factor 2 family protein [Photorhabdus noenieputensis]
MHNNNVAEILTDLIYREAWLLDEQDYDTWLSLLADDYIFWMPLSRNQDSPLTASSLLYEDHFLTRLRINRLNNARNFSQQPRSRSHHVIQRPQIFCETGASDARSVSQVLYTETRSDNERHYAAQTEHHFRLLNGEWKITARKVVLVNPQRPLDSLQLII